MISLLHKVAAVPAVYDVIQKVAGSAKCQEMISAQLAALPGSGAALDVGGGTGTLRALLPATWRYKCLDPDPQKLEGFRSKYPDDQAIEASACDIPCPDGSFDLCIMVAVSHHLTAEEFDTALAETARVLRHDGMFVFVDAVWQPAYFRGRFLWSVDRGSCPKTASDLRAVASKHFVLEHEESWSVHHEYLLLRGRPRGASHGSP